MADLSYIDKYFDQIVRGLPSEDLEKMERGPASISETPVMKGLEVFPGDTEYNPQPQPETIIEAEYKQPIEYPEGYRPKAGESEFYRYNANNALRSRIADASDQAANAQDARSQYEDYSAQSQDAMKKLRETTSKEYQPDNTIKERIDSTLKQFDDVKDVPERDLWSEMILSFAPGVAGMLGNESMKIAQLPAGQKAREIFESRRKEQIEAVKNKRAILQKRYEQLIKIKDEGREAFDKAQQRELDKLKALISGSVDMAKMSKDDMKTFLDDAGKILKEVSDGTIKGSEKIADIESKLTEEEGRNKRADESNKAALERAKIAAAARAKAKKDADMRELAVPGFKLSGEVMPTKQEAVKMRDAVGQLNTMKANIKKMKELVEDNGTVEKFGDVGATMKGVYGDLQMSLKNLYELGAITGPDMEILAKQLSDPSSAWSAFNLKSGRLAELDTLLANLSSRVENNLKAKGYLQEKTVELTPEQREQLKKEIRAAQGAKK